MIVDLFIIGGGPAGYLAAERAADQGLLTALAEKNEVGGVCLNEGCIPSKNLLHSAKLFDQAKGSAEAYGVYAQEAKADLAAIVKRKNKVVRTLTKGVEQTLKAKGVTLFKSEAVIQGRNQTTQLFELTVGDQTVAAKKLLICTGSEAIIPPVQGLADALKSGLAMTNREILDLTEVPRHLVVVGGGVIGLEMAVAFRALGAQVTIIEMLDKIAGPFDPDISKILQQECEQAGIEIHLQSKLVSVEGQTVCWEKEGKRLEQICDRVLISTGRRARVEGFGLDSIRVYLERGHIVTDEQMRTNVPDVYAAGDVNGRSMLAHTAYREAEVAIHTICGIEDAVDYQAVPNVIYTFPAEVAAIGLSEEEAKRLDAQARTVTLPMAYSGRYLAENERGRGMAKLILDRGGNHVLGFSMSGTPASEIITVMALAMAQNTSVGHLKRVIFPHPTVGEIIRELLFR